MEDIQKQQQKMFAIIIVIIFIMFYYYNILTNKTTQPQEKFVTFSEKAQVFGGNISEPLNDIKVHEKELNSIRTTADARYDREEAFLNTKKTPLLNSRLRVDPIAETFNINNRHEVSNSVEITNSALNDDRRFTYKTHGPPIFKTQNQLLSVARS